VARRGDRGSGARDTRLPRQRWLDQQPFPNGSTNTPVGRVEIAEVPSHYYAEVTEAAVRAIQGFLDENPGAVALMPSALEVGANGLFAPPDLYHRSLDSGELPYQ